MQLFYLMMNDEYHCKIKCISTNIKTYYIYIYTQCVCACLSVITLHQNPGPTNKMVERGWPSVTDSNTP